MRASRTWSCACTRATWGDFRTFARVGLAMAREDVARVLAERIEEGQMTEPQALSLARQWFFDNAVELNRLEV